ncbi:MAG: pyrimidine-nucleoside phosphorylase, partial [Oscillospiraceae bacterium]
LPMAKYQTELRSKKSGFVKALHADGIGRACITLGGGRETKDSIIDLSVGVVLNKKVGDYVNQNDCLAVIHSSSLEAAEKVKDIIINCYELNNITSEKQKFIKGIIR